MNDIAPVQHNAPLSLRSENGRSKQEAVATPANTRQPDRLELSEQSQWLLRLQQLPQVREELVARVQSEIEQGSYETPEKIDQAIDDMLEDLIT
jgi:negative regulator of flagellin synthesis FlgM